MKPRQIRNVAASVRQRLLALSRQRIEPFDLMLVRYGSERLLYRLSQSHYVDRFLLKGAMLFTVWTEETHRPTRDIDLLGFGANDTDELAQIFREVSRTDVEPDGLVFRPETVKAESIRSFNRLQIQINALLGVDLSDRRLVFNLPGSSSNSGAFPSFLNN